MKRPRLTFSRVILLIALACIVLSLLPGRWHFYAPPAAGFVNLVTVVVRHPVHYLGSALRHQVKMPKTIDDVARLNEELRYQSNRILYLERRVVELERELAALQKLRVELGDQAVDFVRADVTGRSLDPAAPTLHLNRGAEHGLKPGMAVIDGANLIGRTVQVAPRNAVLRPITTPDTLLNAVITPPRLPREGLPPERRQISQFEAVDADHFAARVNSRLPVETGDLVRLQDEQWPEAAQGMILGEVVEVESLAEKMLLKRIIARPLISIPYLRGVTVLVPQAGSE